MCQPQCLVCTGVLAARRVLFIRFREKGGEKKEERLSESGTHRKKLKGSDSHARKSETEVYPFGL